MISIKLFSAILFIFSLSSVLYAQDQGDLRKGKIGVQFTQNLHSSKFIFDERGGSRFIRLFWNPARSLSFYAAVSLRGVRRDSDGDFSCKASIYSFCIPVKNEYPSPSAVSAGVDYFPFDLPFYTGLRISREKGYSHQAVFTFFTADPFIQQGGALLRSDREDVYSFEVPFGVRWHTNSGVFWGTEISYMRKLGGAGRQKINAIWGASVRDAIMSIYAASPGIFTKTEEIKDGMYWGIYAGIGF